MYRGLLVYIIEILIGFSVVRVVNYKIAEKTVGRPPRCVREREDHDEIPFGNDMAKKKVKKKKRV